MSVLFRVAATALVLIAGCRSTSSSTAKVVVTLAITVITVQPLLLICEDTLASTPEPSPICVHIVLIVHVTYMPLRNMSSNPVDIPVSLCTSALGAHKVIKDPFLLASNASDLTQQVWRGVIL
ncbi:unnamed protein product [Dicrocoelium dendriticum]|nr:unnamed protein product [Dicrocoelium dendriticum]